MAKNKKKYDFLIFGAGGMQGKIVIKDLLKKRYKLFISDIYQNHIKQYLTLVCILPAFRLLY